MPPTNLSVIKYWQQCARKISPAFSFSSTRPDNFSQWQQKLLTAIRERLGPMPEPVDLNPRVEWEVHEEGLIKRRVMLDFEEDMSAPALVYIPEAALEKPAAAILCNHGHAPEPLRPGKDAVMGIRTNEQPEREQVIRQFNYDYGLQMARRGFVTMAIDWRGFGERSEGVDPFAGRDPCNILYIIGSLLGLNLLTLNIFDGFRCIDYLQQLPCVDPQRIGTMGLSFGGTMTTWISLLDPRIKAADISCYSCLFDTFAVGKSNFCGSQFVPGLYALCDVPDLHGLIAPRPLLVEIGLHDKCFETDEALACARQVQDIYQAAGAADMFELDVFNGGHQFAGNKAFDFFARHLNQPQ